MVVLVTGCSTGFGLLTALAFARRGDRVFATMRNVDKAGELLAAAEAEGLKVDVVALDVTDDASVTDAVAAVLREAGTIDVLVNNAGIGGRSAVETYPEELVRAIFETNVFGVLRMLRAVLPTMRENRSGAVVNVSSLAGLMGVPFNSRYSASKHALEAISVTLIEPGYYRTNIGDNVTAMTALSPESPYYQPERAAVDAVPDAVAQGGDPQEVAIEAVLDGVILRVTQHLLGALHRGRRQRGDLSRQLPPRLQYRLLVGIDVVDEADPQRPLGVDVLAGERQLRHMTCGDDPRQTLQGADIGHDRQPRFPNGELGVRRRDPDVARGDQIDTRAYTPPVDRRDSWLRRVGDGADRLLEALHAVETAEGLRPFDVQRSAHAREEGDVDPRREADAASGNHDGAHVVVGVELGHDGGHVPPERKPERISFRLVVEPHRRDVVVLLDRQHRICVCHRPAANGCVVAGAYD